VYVKNGDDYTAAGTVTGAYTTTRGDRAAYVLADGVKTPWARTSQFSSTGCSTGNGFPVVHSALFQLSGMKFGVEETMIPRFKTLPEAKKIFFYHLVHALTYVP
jgi:hypothetical protein